MRFGIVILPQLPWVLQRALWQHAEVLGFDHAWTYDHLSWRSLADEPWGATIPTLTAAATVTSRIRLGTFVASPNFRHPVPFAKDLATLDDIAGGRLLLGVGSGGTGFDAEVLGQSPLTARDRHARFVEFVRDLDVLLRHEALGSGGISFDGEWFTAVRARMVGEPAQQPRLPFVVAADGPRGMRLAVEHGAGWVTLGAPAAATQTEWWRGVGTAVGRLDDALDAAGRARDSIDRYLSLDAAPVFSLSSRDAFADAVGRAGELGFSDVVAHWPRAEGIYAGDEAVLEAVAAAHLTPRA